MDSALNFQEITLISGMKKIEVKQDLKKFFININVKGLKCNF